MTFQVVINYIIMIMYCCILDLSTYMFLTQLFLLKQVGIFLRLFDHIYLKIKSYFFRNVRFMSCLFILSLQNFSGVKYKIILIGQLHAYNHSINCFLTFCVVAWELTYKQNFALLYVERKQHSGVLLSLQMKIKKYKPRNLFRLMRQYVFVYKVLSSS